MSGGGEIWISQLKAEVNLLWGGGGGAQWLGRYGIAASKGGAVMESYKLFPCINGGTPTCPDFTYPSRPIGRMLKADTAEPSGRIEGMKKEQA